MFNIIEYCDLYKDKVFELILHIQCNEYGIAITKEQQPDLNSINEFYKCGHGNFWLALNEQQEVIGTIGLKDIGNNYLALRKMFVKKDFRGKDKNVSLSLLNTAKDWSHKNNINKIFLGTTDAFLAAHRFYETNNFKRIQREELPESFPIMKVDSIFYVYEI